MRCVEQFFISKPKTFQIFPQNARLKGNYLKELYTYKYLIIKPFFSCLKDTGIICQHIPLSSTYQINDLSQDYSFILMSILSFPTPSYLVNVFVSF